MTPEQTRQAEREQQAAVAADGRPPRLADGVELVGRYEDSGFKEPPFVIRRGDGQMIQIPELLYVVAEETNGQRGYDEIAERVGERVGRKLSGENVQFLADEKLRPLGVLAQADGSNPQFKKADPLLALRFRVSVVPEWVVNTITTVFRPLFYPPVVVAVLAGLVALDVWLFGIHGVGQSARELIYQPAYMLLVLGLVIASAAFHECGHATACRYGGAKPGVMGAGLYVVWPAFYTDVTDAYRLGKGARLRTDLGGVYFNVIFSLATAAVYFATGFEVLLVVILLQHLEMLHQFLPFLRMDGYYIISDLTGVPDMFQRIRPTLASLLPWRKADERVKELKPWVRAATTAYVLTLVPVLVLVFGFMLVSTPRIFATAWDSFFVQWDKISDSIAAGHLVGGVAGGVQAVFLVLPAAGISMTFGRAGKTFATGAWRWSQGSAARRAFVVIGSTAVAAALAAVWWPNGEYTPIQPGERGTIGSGVAALKEIDTGRPSLTEERERELGGAPTQSSRNDEIDRSKNGNPVTPTKGSTTPTTTDPSPTTATTSPGETQTGTTPSQTTTTSTTETTSTTTPTTTPTTTTPTTTTTGTTTTGTTTTPTTTTTTTETP
jgi:putative peptide zinc metalloprotease protein